MPLHISCFILATITVVSSCCPVSSDGPHQLGQPDMVGHLRPQGHRAGTCLRQYMFLSLLESRCQQLLSESSGWLNQLCQPDMVGRTSDLKATVRYVTPYAAVPLASCFGENYVSPILPC
jgi:hypothetical protein